MKHERCHRCGKSIRDDCCTWGCEGPSLREAAQDSARALAALREDELARLRTALAASEAREAALREAVVGVQEARTTTTTLLLTDETHTPRVIDARAALRRQLDRLNAVLADPSPAAEALLARAKRCDEVERQVGAMVEERETAALAVLLGEDGGPLVEAISRLRLRAEKAEAEVARVTADLGVQNTMLASMAASLADEMKARDAADDRADAAIAEAAAMREAYERDERVVCKACEGVGALAGPDVGMGGYSTRPPCKTCRGTGTVRAPLPDPSPAVAALLAAREVAEEVSAWVAQYPDGLIKTAIGDSVARYKQAREKAGAP